MVYKFREGTRCAVSAQVVGEECEKLEKNGELTAKNLVEVSRPEEAPLHRAFNWNDEEAAELYREEQARNLIRCIIVCPEESKVITRAYYNILKSDPQYHSINTILQSEEKYEALLETAKKELKSFQKKYATLKQLEPVFEAIEKITA